jgi:hypothetical protein
LSHNHQLCSHCYVLAENSEYAGQYVGASDEHESIHVSDLITKLNHVYTAGLLNVGLEWIKYSFVYAFNEYLLRYLLLYFVREHSHHLFYTLFSERVGIEEKTHL